jgi:hypothetical protein
MHIKIFYSLLDNIFVSVELGRVDMTGASQDLEGQVVICKILLNKELAVRHRFGVPVLGVNY